jgi:hypothetical protein
MADKTGMEVLLPILGNLYRDYLAFRHIARTAEPEKWAVHLNDYKRANSARIQQQFDAIIDDLQSSLPGPEQACDVAARKVADLLVAAMLS